MKTALITGASKGIGAACSEALADLGYRVIINYNKSKDKAEALQNKIRKNGGTAYAICADVSKESGVMHLFSEIKKIAPGVDLLINNAGISHIGLFTDVSIDDYDSIFDTNMKSVFLQAGEGIYCVFCWSLCLCIYTIDSVTYFQTV